MLPMSLDLFSTCPDYFILAKPDISQLAESIFIWNNFLLPQLSIDLLNLFRT